MSQLLRGVRTLRCSQITTPGINLLGHVTDGFVLQGFLAEGLQRTSAGLGSVIIDSQPLSVAVLAALVYGEKLTAAGLAGLAVGVTGLSLLEVSPEVFACRNSMFNPSAPAKPETSQGLQAP